MSESIEEVVKSWLVDPSWQKVFKHTFDVLQDYVSYVLVTTGIVALSVRLINTLGSGEITCVIMGVLYNGTSVKGGITPYPGGGMFGFLNYAVANEGCIRSVLDPFLVYLPYIMIVQSLILTVVEKFTFRVPRIAQKVERFHKNIVDQSLFGKDPDVAEDMTDHKTSTDVISRKRQRNEICVSLKQSSIIHDVYIGKKCLEMALCVVFILLNLSFGNHPTNNWMAVCSIHMLAFRDLHPLPGQVFFQFNGTWHPDAIYPYAGHMIAMINFAQNNEDCISGVMDHFMLYLPFIMMLQTMLLIVVEKFTFRIPRIAQKVERFHKNIVEESLFGRDPDVAEDMTDPKTSTEVISRKRQRNEICMSLKRSSVIHNVYLCKKILEIIIGALFLMVDISFASTHQDTDVHTKCVIRMLRVPGLLEKSGRTLYQVQPRLKPDPLNQLSRAGSNYELYCTD